MGLFGTLIRKARFEKDISVKKLIERLGRKVSGAYITKIEMWDHIPSPELVLQLCCILKIDLNVGMEAAKKDKRMEFEKRLQRAYDGN
jgi:ribosome-binding protein aMBF1 (putative translation factor)